MPTKIYHKLVRDRIPEIIEADGKTCVCETLSDEDYLYLLDQKLNEELAEYQESKSLEELADLLEVMQAVVKARGWTMEDLERMRTEKATKLGGFEKKVLLKEVHSSSDYHDLALKILNNQKDIIKKIPPQMLNTYYWLQDNLHLRNIARDFEYRRKFAGYYRMRFVSQQYRDSYPAGLKNSSIAGPVISMEETGAFLKSFTEYRGIRLNECPIFILTFLI